MDLTKLLQDIPVASDQPRRPLFRQVGPDEYVLEIDNTTLERFQTCPRSAEWYCVHGRQEISKSALLFGAAIHEGLAVLYRKGFDALTEACYVTMEHMRPYYVETSDEWRTPQLACETLVAYVEQYKLERLRIFRPNDHPFVEKPFGLHVGDVDVNSVLAFDRNMLLADEILEPMYIGKLHVMWTGRIDLIASIDETDMLFVIDHKTTSIGGEQFFADFILSQQMQGYIWAARQLFPQAPIAGSVVNAIIQRKPTRTGKSLEFGRVPHYSAAWQQEEWKQDILHFTENFISSLIHGVFPKSTKWCFGKFGKCAYHDVCTLPPEYRLAALHGSAFQNVTWSPLH